MADNPFTSISPIPSPKIPASKTGIQSNNAFIAVTTTQGTSPTATNQPEKFKDQVKDLKKEVGVLEAFVPLGFTIMDATALLNKDLETFVTRSSGSAPDESAGGTALSHLV